MVRKMCEQFPNIIFVKNEYNDLKDKLHQLEVEIEGLTFDYSTRSFSWEDRALKFKKVFDVLSKKKEIVEEQV